MPDFLRISNARDKTGLGINDLIQGHYVNYIYLQSLEGLSQKEKRDLDGLTFLLAGNDLQTAFRYLSSEYSGISQSYRPALLRAASCLAKGSISIKQFEKLFGMRHDHTRGEIIERMNNFITEVPS